MDAALFTNMLSDKRVTDLKKLGYKYPQANMEEFIGLLKNGFYRTLPLKDFHGEALVYLESTTRVRLSAARLLLTPQNSTQLYGTRAMEEEIISTFTIENINFTRESVRRIMAGYAPTDESENRIFGMKKGLEFISDPENVITEENIFRLYETAVGAFLPPDEQLLPGNRYRHDAVYIVGERVEHTGIQWEKLHERMGELTAFIHTETDMNDLLKAALIHFYVAYLHPYFDGNGRMARLLHLWYLVQRGYSSALFIPLSEYVNRSRRGYYDAYTRVEENARISGLVDVTPFLIYFIENVYHKLDGVLPPQRTTDGFERALAQGKVTEKEEALWRFVLSVYGNSEFTTKGLERDFNGAAYATIRGFVRKFEELGLLQSKRYGNRVRYRVSG